MGESVGTFLPGPPPGLDLDKESPRTGPVQGHGPPAGLKSPSPPLLPPFSRSIALDLGLPPLCWLPTLQESLWPSPSQGALTLATPLAGLPLVQRLSQVLSTTSGHKVPRRHLPLPVERLREGNGLTDQCLQRNSLHLRF